MLSLTILLFVIAVMTVSLNVPEVVLSPASISGTLLAIFLIFLIVSKTVLLFHRPQHA